MVVTSVVTYTFPIGPFLGAPSSRYGPSVDWGEICLYAAYILSFWSSHYFRLSFIAELNLMLSRGETLL